MTSKIRRLLRRSVVCYGHSIQDLCLGFERDNGGFGSGLDISYGEDDCGFGEYCVCDSVDVEVGKVRTLMEAG